MCGEFSRAIYFWLRYVTPLARESHCLSDADGLCGRISDNNCSTTPGVLLNYFHSLKSQNWICSQAVKMSRV
jgi:hypothetical protein